MIERLSGFPGVPERGCTNVCSKGSPILPSNILLFPDIRAIDCDSSSDPPVHSSLHPFPFHSAYLQLRDVHFFVLFWIWTWVLGIKTSRLNLFHRKEPAYFLCNRVHS